MSDELRDLKEKVSKLSDDELMKMVHVDSSDYREDAIIIAKDELKKRNIIGIDDSKKEELQRKAIIDLPVSWMKFYNYWLIPGAIFQNLVMIPVTQETKYGIPSDTLFIMGLIIAIPLVFLFIGLRRRRLWGWKLNWFILVAGLLLNPLNITEDMIIYLVLVALGFLVWFLPNYIYFNLSLTPANK